MQEYIEFTKMSPLELVEEAEAETRVKPRRQKIRGYITEFRGFLINKGVAPQLVVEFGNILMYFDCAITIVENEKSHFFRSGARKRTFKFISLGSRINTEFTRFI